MLVWPRLPGAPNIKTRLRCVISLYMGGLKVEYPFMSCGHTALFRNVQIGHLSTISSPDVFFRIVVSVSDSTVTIFCRGLKGTRPRKCSKDYIYFDTYLIF